MGNNKCGSLNDAITIVECMGYKIDKLNMKNKDRVFITKYIRNAIKERQTKDILEKIEIDMECMRNRKQWKGLLHHIHFKPETIYEKSFCNYMFNIDYKPPRAVDPDKEYVATLNKKIASATDIEQKQKILENIPKLSGPENIRMYWNYYCYDTTGKNPRTFVFRKRNGQLKKHVETKEEMKRRKSLLSKEDAEMLKNFFFNRYLDS